MKKNQELLSVIEKIKKLFRLSESANEHEAALAAEKARELLEAYNLGTFDIEEKTFSSAVEEQVFMESGRLMRWKRELILKLSDIFDLQYMYSGLKQILLGLPQDMEVFKFSYAYLDKQIRKYSQDVKREYLNSYRLGLVFRIYSRLDEAKKKGMNQSSCTDLVLAKDRLICQYLEEKYPNIRTVKRKTQIDHAFQAGYDKGADIPLSQAVGSSSAFALE